MRVRFSPPIQDKMARNSLMNLSADFLEIVRCPACKAPVALKTDGSGLKCESCQRVYPIRDDIPIMLVDEARIETDNAAPAAS
jgi:uncharacterized protein YbaR (Trm112 family)